jgi:CHAT domain-containing protein/predicted negative regulator of RcsB-dependent stress response
VATTSNPGYGSKSADELLHRLPRLHHKSAQTKFLASHAELLNSETVVWISDLIRDQSKVNPARAIPLAQLAMAIADKLRDKSARARSLRAMGNALYLAGQNKAAVQFHARARRMFATLRDRAELARTLSASTQPLILTGQYQVAESNARQALRIFSALRDRGRVARLNVNIGNIFHRQDRVAEALKFYRRAYRHFLADAGKDPEGLGVALHNIALCLVNLNDFHGALAAHQEARSIAEKHDMHVLVAQADYNIARLHYLRGEYSRAIRMLLATREACKKSEDEYHVALCHLDLSEIYLELNLYGPAEEMAGEASTGFHKLSMGYEAGKSLLNLALAMARQNKPVPAMEMLGEARKQFIREKNSIWPYMSDLHKAAILIELGRHDEGQQLCVAANKFFRTTHNSSKVVESQLLLSRSFLLAGKPRTARKRCAQAVAALEKIELPVLACEVEQFMGKICLAEGARGEAYDHYQAARRLLEDTRSHLHNEEMKMSFIEDKLEIYEGLVELCLEPNSEKYDLAKAFEYIEESKSRALQDSMLLSGYGDSASETENETQRKALELRADINWHSHRLAQETLLGSKASHKVISALEAAIHKRESEMLRLVREIPASEAALAGIGSSRAATLEEIRESLPPESTLIEYFQIRQRLLAVILTQETLEIVPLMEDRQGISSLFEKLQFQLSKFRLGPEYISAFKDSLLQATQQHLKDLHDALIAPLNTYLKGRHLVIVPHGALHRLPFQALFDGRQYLIDKFSVSYAPSATIHSLCGKRPVNSHGAALVMGIPDEIAPLILDEATQVANIVPNAELFLGKDATAAVLRDKGPECRFIHIATHGYFRQNSPMFSGIRLGDSILSLLDLYRFKLPAELVTLSGCSTGMSVLAGGDDLLGLVRGLLYAGSRAALLTLWDVQDRSTLEFMTTFYRYLTAGHNKAVALQKASLDIRERHPHPYYWAPFTLIGNL